MMSVWVPCPLPGTGAMKSGFTRTGKRTVGGMIDDGVKAVLRYYLNNFQDGKKQDAVDLITGKQHTMFVNMYIETVRI